MPWAAEFLTDTDNAELRGARRRMLRLTVATMWSKEPAHVAVLNLSRTGLLIETEEKLAAGETFDVTLPEIGTAEVSVVWNTGQIYGCEFARPISEGAVSAALLRAPARPAASETALSGFRTAPSEYQPSEYHNTEQAVHADRALSKRTKLLILFGSSLTLWATLLIAAW